MCIDIIWRFFFVGSGADCIGLVYMYLHINRISVGDVETLFD